MGELLQVFRVLYEVTSLDSHKYGKSEKSGILINEWEWYVWISLITSPLELHGCLDSADRAQTLQFRRRKQSTSEIEHSSASLIASERAKNQVQSPRAAGRFCDNMRSQCFKKARSRIRRDNDSDIHVHAFEFAAG